MYVCMLGNMRVTKLLHSVVQMYCREEALNDAILSPDLCRSRCFNYADRHCILLSNENYIFCETKKLNKKYE